MKNSLLLALLASSWLMGGNLTVTKADIKAHTEVFADTKIDPHTTQLVSHLSMGSAIKSIKGRVDIGLTTLKSDNAERDEHMMETIHTKQYPMAHYTFIKVQKSAHGYKVSGILDFNGVKKPLDIDANIVEKKNQLIFKGTSSFLMTQYAVTPPKLLFFKVRDQIDLKIDAIFKKH